MQVELGEAVVCVAGIVIDADLRTATRAAVAAKDVELPGYAAGNKLRHTSLRTAIFFPRSASSRRAKLPLKLDSLGTR